MKYKIAVGVASALVAGGVLASFTVSAGSGPAAPASSPVALSDSSHSSIKSITVQNKTSDGKLVMQHLDVPVYERISGLTADADVVVIGTVVEKGGSRNLARDPRDHSKEDPQRRVESQEYTFQVDKYLKGSGEQKIQLVYAAKEVNSSRNLEITRPEVALAPGQRYVLFLRKGISAELGYYGVGQPWQFRLDAGTVRAMAFDAEHAKPFQGLNEAELLRQVGQFNK